MKEPFEQAIFKDPHDVNNYLVYADWLTDQGDPRGEFIRVQVSLEDESLATAQRQEIKQREEQLLKRHEAEWLGPFAPFLTDIPTVNDPETWEDRPLYTYRFERGFLAVLDISSLRVPMARTIRDASETRFLRELSFTYIEGEGESEEEYELGDDVPTWESDRIQFVSVYPLLGRAEFESLQKLQVGGVEDMDLFLTQQYGRDCHCYCNCAADLVESMPNLKELKLLCKSFDIEKLFASAALRKLESLWVYHLGVRGGNRKERNRYEYPLDVLANNETFHNLKTLRFHPHHEEYHQDHYGGPHLPSFLPLDQIQALMASEHLQQLEHLQLRLSNAGDEGVRALVNSPHFARLKFLDLRHGCITDDGAAIFAAAEHTSRLDMLDLSRNRLTDKGIDRLKAAGVNLRAERQQTDEEFAQEQYLLEGDSE